MALKERPILELTIEAATTKIMMTNMRSR
jgi:hypothetical protein